MKKNKRTLKLLLFLQLLLLIGFVSCKKDDVLLIEDNAPQTQNLVEPKDEIVLGEKIENAYSVENMKKAYESLKKDNRLKSITSEEIEIVPTHLYVRFLPKDSTDLQVLEKDTALELFDYPLDYNIEEEGLYYHDPEIPEGQPTWQYTSVPVDYNFPNVEYEIIEECFIPEEDSEDTKLKSNGYSKLLALLEFESMKLTDNLLEEEIEQSKLKGWFSRWWPSKENPTGFIKVNNTSTGLEGVKRVKIRTHRIVKWSTTYTDENGYYRIPKGYRYNVHYAILFENSTGFKVWGNRAYLGAARYNMGWHSKSGHSLNIHTNSVAWLWSTVNNGTYVYREELCPKFGITKPSASLRLWTIRRDGDNLGSAPMARQISMRASTFKDFSIGLGVSIGTLGLYTVLPDIFIIKNFDDTQEAYGTIFHELAHASHYTKAGKWYWLKYIQGIIDNGGDYGDGTAKNDGYIGVGEMWGNYFGFICEDDYFGNANFNPTENWFNSGILQRLDDVYGFSVSQIYSCMTSGITNHTKFKENLIKYYGQDADINEAFSFFGF